MAELGGPYDAIVIGSGMSGLAAANVLAIEGMKVLVCEQHYRYGGYMHQFMDRKTPFDTGCHYVGALGPGQVFDRYLRYLGVRDAIEARPLDPDGFDRVVGPGGLVAFPVGHAALADRLAERFPHQAEGARAFVQAVRSAAAGFGMYALDDQGSDGGDDEPTGAADRRTVSEVLADCGISDPALRETLLAHSLLYLVAPDEAPFGLHALVLDSYLQGAWTIRGGGHALTRALVHALHARGGVTRRNTRVTAIDVSLDAGRPRVSGIRTADGRHAQAPVVISAIDPTLTAEMVPDAAVRPAWRHRLQRRIPGIGGFACFLRLDEAADLQELRDHNLFLVGPGGMDALYDERWVDSGQPPPIFITAPGTREPDWRGPQSVVVITAMRAERWQRWADSATGERGPAYEARKAEIAAQVMAPAYERLPVLREHLLSMEVATPLTHRDYTLNRGGAIYGHHHSVDQVGARGLGWRTRIDGLFLTGHSVLYPGLLGACISAFYTTGELVGLETLRQRLVSL